MFSTRSFISVASRAISATAPSVNSSVTPSVASSAMYCLIRLASGSTRMRARSLSVSGLSSTRIGSRPCSSGSRSEGLLLWNAPLAMNRMCSVRTAPCLVVTLVPSISGNRSRCTPSRETSAPPRCSRELILSISSRNTMPFCSTAVSPRA